MAIGKALQDVQTMAHDKNRMQTDEWYLNEIERYKDTEFYERLKNNPYLRSNNAQFSPNLLQSVAGIFGDTSPEDEYYGNLLNLRNQYYTEILEAMRQQEHDHPANEVARRRAAGLNDDLSGGQAIGTGEAAENDQGMVEPPGMGGQAANQAQGLKTIWETFATAYSATMGFIQDGQIIKSNALDLDNKEMNVIQQMFGAANGAYDFGRKYGSDGRMPVEEFATTFRPLFRNEKRFRKWKELYYMGLGNVDNTLKNLGSDTRIREAEMENVWTRGKQNAYGMDVGGEILREWSKTWHSMEKELQIINQRVEKKMAENRGKYEEAKDYRSAAVLENRQVGAALAKFQVEKTINEHMAKFTNKLDEMSKEKGIKGFAASCFLGIMSLQNMQMIPVLNLPNLNFSKRIFNTSTTNNVDMMKNYNAPYQPQ